MSDRLSEVLYDLAKDPAHPPVGRRQLVDKPEKPNHKTTSKKFIEREEFELKEVALILNCSITQAHAWATQGYLKAYKRPFTGNEIKVKRADLEDFMRKGFNSFMPRIKMFDKNVETGRVSR